jgi:hypothetical protein
MASKGSKVDSPGEFRLCAIRSIEEAGG